VLPCGPLSHVHRLRVDTDDDAPQRSCVLKTAPRAGAGEADGARRLARANRHFEREVGFYRAMRTERTPLAIPLLHFAGCDKASGRAALLLEDCEADGRVRADADVAATSGGYESGSDTDGAVSSAPPSEQGLSADAAPLLVRALAAHHAHFWNGAPFTLWRWLPEMNGASGGGRVTQQQQPTCIACVQSR
jgi:hypothetical protein